MATAENEVSTSKRWAIVALLSASITINLVDRQTVSVMASTLTKEFHWSNTQFALIGTLFQIGMLLGQVPAGAFMDAVGTRTGLAAIFCLWSLLCGIHSVAAGLTTFLVLRLIMGVSQCGNYTAGIKTIAGLFPASQRSTAGGLFNAGAQFGSVIAIPIITFLMTNHGWHVAFVVPAVAGLLWLIPWLALAPGKQQAQAATGQKAAPALSFGYLIKNRKVFGLFLIRVCTGPLTFFYWFWLVKYLGAERHMASAAIAAIAWLPNFAGMIGNLAGGFMSSVCVKVFGSIDRARKAGFTGAYVLSAMSIFVPHVSSIPVAIFLMCLALFGNQWAAATYIATVGDTFPASVAGRVNGLAGIGDSSATLTTTLVAGIIADKYSFTPVFHSAGLLPVLALMSVYFVLRRIEPEQIAAQA